MIDYQNAPNMVPNGSGAGWVKTSGRLTVFLKNQKRYEENGFTTDKLRDGHFYLQSHWGSAVVFTSATFVLN